MATKNQTPEQETAVKELCEIGELRDRYRISWAVFAGVCAANGWKPGKAVSPEEFCTAVNKFTKSPMRGDR